MKVGYPYMTTALFIIPNTITPSTISALRIKQRIPGILLLRWKYSYVILYVMAERATGKY